MHRTLRASARSAAEGAAESGASDSNGDRVGGGGAGIKRPRAKLVNGRAMATAILEEVRVCLM